MSGKTRSTGHYKTGDAFSIDDNISVDVLFVSFEEEDF